MTFASRVVLCLLLTSPVLRMAAQPTTVLKPETVRAFESYSKRVESDNNRRISAAEPLVWVTDTARNREQLRQGKVLNRKIEPKGVKVPDGLIHDWVGAAFFPGTTAEQVVQFLRDINRHAEFYDEVLDARLISHEGNVVRSSLRLRKKKVITVVLNTEHEARYRQLTGKRWYMASRSTRIAQVKDPDSASEAEHPVGGGSGFLWRLNAYWRIDEADGGVYVELRTLSLTRGIPMGLGWIVKPFVTSIPRESLGATLEGTRRAVLGQR
ncbi:MAG: hypothetical protein GY953_56770 [bacterium]|nr:hypothetical protein [bacterium]